MTDRGQGRPLLFYANWDLGYFNIEAERKAIHFAANGFDTAYCDGVGIRNPPVAAPGRVLQRARAVVRPRTGAWDRPGLPAGLRRASALVIPPRQVAAIRRLNAAWLERRLPAEVGPWEETVAWIRYPTPELVDMLERRRPRAVVYECVDAYDDTPGIVGRWAPVFADAERRMATLADTVVASSPVLGERFAAWAQDVRVIPHGVDLAAFERVERTSHTPTVAGFVGTLDYRIDVAAVRMLATRRPDWRIRLIGAAQPGFDPASVNDLANVSVEDRVPHERLPEVLAGFDLGLMPYVDMPHVRHMTPVKNLEYLAAGLPAVVRPLQSLEPFADLLYLADDPEAFADAAERAVAEDGPERVAARRARAAEHTWSRRLDELVALVAELVERTA